MSLLSKSKILFLQNQKHVSKNYEYKLRSTIKKKLANLLDNEIPLLSKLFPDLTEFGKNCGQNKENRHPTEFGKAAINETITNNLDKVNKNYSIFIKTYDNIT